MRQEIIEEIIAHMELDVVPPEFIIAAHVTNMSGDVREVTKDELKVILQNPRKFSVVEASIVLDVQKMSAAVDDEVERILLAVHADD